MYINPILFGALTAIVSEIVIVFTAAIIGWCRSNKRNRR